MIIASLLLFVYSYDGFDRDNRVTSHTFDGAGNTLSYSYDVLGRVFKKTVSSLNNEYEIRYAYLAGGYGENSTSPLVSSIIYPNFRLSYAYDSRGNITKERRIVGDVTTDINYAYDNLGQLVKVEDPFDKTGGDKGTLWEYKYDRCGNILKNK